MKRFKEMISFLRKEDGVVMVEYALIGALIAVALVATMILLKDEIVNIFNYIISALQGAQT